ncbi:MAG: hypothetical protein JNM36_11460 [Chitinophagales bacterium]|nr:hypothetical protein [Chitinophagales bacterium]
MKRIYLLFIIAFFSSCTISKRVHFLDKKIDQCGLSTTEKRQDIKEIPSLNKSGYMLNIYMNEIKTMSNPYSNHILIRVGRKKPIAYWIRFYDSVTDSLGNEFTLETRLKYLANARRDIIVLHPSKKQIKEILDFIIKNKMYLTHGMQELHEKCNASVYDPMEKWRISVSKQGKASIVSYDNPDMYLDMCPDSEELKTFIKGIQLIRRAVGANPVPRLERYLFDNSLIPKQE